MSIKVGNYIFEGSYLAPGDLRNKPGLFLVTEFLNNRHRVLDLDQAQEVRKAVETHSRRDCWLQKSKKYELRVSVLYTPDLTAAKRAALEKELRIRLAPPCGIQAKTGSVRRKKGSIKSKKKPVKRRK